MSKKDENMRFGTKTIHAGLSPDVATGAVMTPIYQTSTYQQKSTGEHSEYEYSRTGNPSRKALEDNLAALENAAYGLCFGSGMAAIDAILKMLQAGDEVIACNGLYGGSYRLFTSIFKKFDIRFTFVSMQDTKELEAAINEKTKLIWIETPGNPMLNIIDIQSVSNVAKQNELILAVDNTFATPYLQSPIDLGADIAMHSVTKYLGGHSDVVMGAVITNDKKIAEQLYAIQNSSGAICGPFDSFLALRGIKTLHLRMQRHCENAVEIAHFLNNHPKVNQVFWPGFSTHLNHDIAKKQMRDFGGMISFSIKGNSHEDAKKFMDNLKIITVAESLGGVESLISHPASMSHSAIPKSVRESAGITDSLVRLSVGIEDVDDLIEDLEQALN